MSEKCYQVAMDSREFLGEKNSSETLFSELSLNYFGVSLNYPHYKNSSDSSDIVQTLPPLNYSSTPLYNY